MLLHHTQVDHGMQVSDPAYADVLPREVDAWNNLLIQLVYALWWAPQFFTDSCRLRDIHRCSHSEAMLYA